MSLSLQDVLKEAANQTAASRAQRAHKAAVGRKRFFYTPAVREALRVASEQAKKEALSR